MRFSLWAITILFQLVGTAQAYDSDEYVSVVLADNTRYRIKLGKVTPGQLIEFMGERFTVGQGGDSTRQVGGFQPAGTRGTGVNLEPVAPRSEISALSPPARIEPTGPSSGGHGQPDSVPPPRAEDPLPPLAALPPLPTPERIILTLGGYSLKVQQVADADYFRVSKNQGPAEKYTMLPGEKFELGRGIKAQDPQGNIVVVSAIGASTYMDPYFPTEAERLKWLSESLQGDAFAKFQEMSGVGVTSLIDGMKPLLPTYPKIDGKSMLVHVESVDAQGNVTFGVWRNREEKNSADRIKEKLGAEVMPLAVRLDREGKFTLVAG